MYSEKILRHFKNPKFAGEIKNPDAVGQAGNPRCGDVMKIFLKVDKGIIKNIKFKTFGCIAAIAASDMMCELAKGKTIDNALRIKADDIVKGLGKMPPIKYHCSILGTQALKKAIENYKRSKK
ncbi:iron-sulfur cluster assembly scaffold protein [Candidatus Woesearchaeota archaeon]|nr:iron-sulfur cluster assembly scaffold protein [Candidatus Woesearchaeota archaeon]MBU3942206.1 iron-sulfur cluster assembly scaffold protein [Nanoarchaeota archaeon]